MTQIWAIGVGQGTPAEDGAGWLEAWYPLLCMPTEAESRQLDAVLGGERGVMAPPAGLGEAVAELTGAPALVGLHEPAGNRRPVCCVLERDGAIASSAEAYLKLHLLSARLARPNSLNLDGLFQHLPNLAWTTAGPLPPEGVQQARLEQRRRGHELWVHALDKFPPLTQYLVPPEVRIADSARVRLGAWIGPGTTIMHSGSINFNAGTEGVAMVEGRIAQGVVVGDDSDIGGGSSTLGQLSGGGTQLVSLGSNCLIGANAGLGIALGDRCTIESGLYLTAGCKVQMLDEDGKPQHQCRATELIGQSDLVFWRNSVNGAIECRPNRKAASLNQDLHDHN